MDRNKKRILYTLILLYIALYYAWIISINSTQTYFYIVANTLQTIPFIITLLVVLNTHLKRYDKKDYSWLIVSVGVFANLIGQCIVNYYDIFLKTEVPMPGIADVFWTIIVVTYFISLVYIFHKQKTNKSTLILLIDSMIIMCMAVQLTWIFMILPHDFYMSNLNIIEIIFYIIYPIVGLGILFCSISLWICLDKENSQRQSFFMLFTAFLIMCIGDLIYSYLVGYNLYDSGSLLDPLWSLYIFTLMLSAIEYRESQTKKSTNKVLTNNSLKLMSVLLCISIIILFALMTLKQDIVTWMCFGISIGLINIRQIIISFQNKNLILKLKDLNENLEKQVQKRTKELKDIAYYDYLTGLPNRRLFEERLKDLIIKNKIDKNNFGLMFLDLDRFKLVNDTLGHSYGDILLKKASKRLIKCLDDKSTIYRQGGDEFSIIAEEIDNEQTMIDISQNILADISKPIDLDGHSVCITCSIGIAIYPQDGEDYETLVKHVDIAMYDSKDSGKNTYAFYDMDMKKIASKKLTIERELRKAIENDEFILYYQPQVDIFTLEIVGLEALIRWEHPTKGTISPLEFIPIAEETGLICTIGKWVLESACTQTKIWHDMGFDFIKIGVNISSRQFQQEDFISIITNALETTQLEPNYLDLEITESVSMKNEDFVISKLRELKSLGITVSIDDFGTGYSSLSYLKKFPIDTLKIPREFIREIDNCKDDRSIIDAIIAIAQKLDLNIVAEGIETELQLEFLKSRKCTSVQGYLFSKPICKDSIEDILKSQFHKD